ncbi:MAG: diguanylate cyclase [Phycisphaera sp.]|nr:diguanylate cyclase [Phycisphaera sp.]
MSSEYPSLSGKTLPTPDVSAMPTRTPRASSWTDAPLRTKVTLLIVLAAVGGSLVGMLEARLGHTVWPLAVGLLGLTLLLVSLGRSWVWRPMERLLEHLGRISAHHRPLALRSLPVHRKDEVGQLARALQDLSIWAARDHADATQLRRTLDHRIARATRSATVRLEMIAMRDPLTNLGNRRFLDEHLAELFNSCREAGDDLVCIAVDLDEFKAVNDTLGHAKGDEVLRMLATLIRGCIRHGDIAVRQGGDEFVVLLPGCTVERAGQLASQLIALFAQNARGLVDTSVKPGLSIGIASLHRDGVASGAELLAAADTALYTAKKTGKGRVVGV